MNILIAVPSMDTVPAVFAQALAMLHKVGNCAIAFQVGSLIYTSRNALATRAIEMGADYVLWLDSDMFFEPDTLERMLKRMQENDLDILTGVYYRRGEPYTPVLNDVLKMNSDDIPIWHDMTELPEEELFQVEGCGFGCILMKSDVLLDVQATFKDMFSPLHRCGEDLSFCIRARRCGYKIWADSSIRLGHWGHTLINRTYYEAFKAAKEKDDERGA